MRKRIVRAAIAVTIIAILAVVVWRWRSSHKEPEVVYKGAAVEKRAITGKVTASGTLAALVTVQVGAQVSGRVQALYADFNSPVKKGQLIAKLDPQLFAAAVQQAQANFLSSQASMRRADAEVARSNAAFTRAKALRQQNLAADGDVETAEATWLTAKANLDAAKATIEQSRASLNQAQVNLSYCDISSPIDGVVISRSVDVGQTVAASLQAPVLFTIAEDLRKMNVDTNVSEGDVGRLEVGMKSFFTVDAFPGRRFRGEIATIHNAATTVQNVVTYDAKIHVDNADLKLRPGMTATVTIVYAEKTDAIALPNAALRFKPAGIVDPQASARRGGPGGGRKPDDETTARTVWVLENNNVSPHTVKLGLTDGAYTELVEGDIVPGMQLAIDATGQSTSSAQTAQPPPGLGGVGGSSGGGRRGL